MKQFVFLFLMLCALHVPAQKQHLGVNLNLGIRKNIQLVPRFYLDLRQQLQLNPEFRQYELKYGDIFNEEAFWSIPDRYEDDDHDGNDDDDDDEPVVVTPSGELNDAPRELSLEGRSSSIVRLQYNTFDWLRGSTAYTLFYNGEEFRHAFQGDLDYRPLRHSGESKKWDLSLRAGFQRTAEPRKRGGYRWESFLTPRATLNWRFKKKHNWYGGSALNGGWDEDFFEFDRWRLNTGIQFMPNKRILFDLGYQYQKRIGRTSESHTLNITYQFRF